MLFWTNILDEQTFYQVFVLFVYQKQHPNTAKYMYSFSRVPKGFARLRCVFLCVCVFAAYRRDGFLWFQYFMPSARDI